MPLDGLWLRGPYLHNGSVPTLRDLLAPPVRAAGRLRARHRRDRRQERRLRRAGAASPASRRRRASATTRGFPATAMAATSTAPRCRRPRRKTFSPICSPSSRGTRWRCPTTAMEDGAGAGALLWFQRVVWIGIVANVGDHADEHYLHRAGDRAPRQLDPATPLVWPRFGAFGILLLTGFYVLAAVDPCRSRYVTVFTVLCRFGGFMFFAIVGGRTIAFGLFDLLFGAPQAVLLYLAWRRTQGRCRRQGDPVRRVRAGRSAAPGCSSTAHRHS